MAGFDFKVPTSKEEMEALRKSLRQEVSDEALDSIVGGNDDMKGKAEGFPFTCPFCGAQMIIKQVQDCAKHVVKCPNNPYK